MLPLTHTPINFENISNERIKIRSMYHEKGFSSVSRVYGRQIILEKILIALENLPENYGVIVWDVYRPREVQKKLFEWMRGKIKRRNPALTDEENYTEARKYMSPPSQAGDSYCPPHLSGGAIDLTLFDRETGKELDMGTAFDDCTECAHSDYFERGIDLDEHSQLIQKNRRILKHAMVVAGFTSYPFEWWHYDYGNIFWANATGKAALFGPLFGDLEWPSDDI